MAVPNVPVPSIVKCIEDAPLMGALLNSAAISRMFGLPQPKRDENQEQATSVLDYEEMNDNGYLTIPFGELDPEKAPQKFINETDSEEKISSFLQRTDEAEESNINFSESIKKTQHSFYPIWEETLLARNYYASEEVQEEEIVPVVQDAEENQIMIFEQNKQVRNEDKIQQVEPVNQIEFSRTRDQKLKEEIISLRDIVHRLNIELSKYQAKCCSAQSINQSQNIEGLPTQGPIPSWLISTKYLSPLVMEYGEQIQKLEANVDMYKKEFEKASKHCTELITENETLHEKLEKLTSGSGHILERSIMEQRLDLLTSENLILLEQIKSEKTKNRDIVYTHSSEVQELKDHVRQKREQCSKLEEEVAQEMQKNQELKISLDRLESENQNKIALTEHKNILESINKKHQEFIAEHEKSKSELIAKLESCYKDKETFLDVQAQCKDKIERMHNTIKSLKTKTKDTEMANRKLVEALKLTQNMEYLSQEQLQKFRITEEVVQKIIEKQAKSSEEKKQMKNKIKIYKEKLSDELYCKKESINNLRQEFEIQIQQLYSKLKHKEHLLQISEDDRLKMENDMEILWQAAQNENQVMHQILKRISCKCQSKSLLSDDH